jgi:hypothetical protein
MVDLLVLAGALAAWTIAFATTLILACLSQIGKARIYQETKRKLDILAAATLSFTAINIVSPFPILTTSLSVFVQTSSAADALLKILTLKHVFLISLTIAGLSYAFLSTRRGTEVIEESNPSHFLRLMTWLPAPLQIWVLTAGTRTFVELDGILSTGLFILAGPGAWQFAIFVVSNSGLRAGIRHITRIMLVSLLLTIAFAAFGLLLAHLVSLGGFVQIQEAVFPYSAALSLLIVAYFFFYSFWGETWADSRPIATVGAIALFALLTSVRLGEEKLQLPFSFLTWLVLLCFPVLVYDQEYERKAVFCSACGTAPPGGIGSIVLYLGAYSCDKHPTTTVSVQKIRFLANTSVRRKGRILFQGLRFAPWRRNLSVEMAPKKQNFQTGEPYSLSIDITNRLDHPAFAHVSVVWKSRTGRISETTADNVELGSGSPVAKTTTWELSGAVPSLDWSAVEPRFLSERLTIVVKVGITSYRYAMSIVPFYLVPYRRRKFVVSIARPV